MQFMDFYTFVDNSKSVDVRDLKVGLFSSLKLDALKNNEVDYFHCFLLLCAKPSSVINKRWHIMSLGITRLFSL